MSDFLIARKVLREALTAGTAPKWKPRWITPQRQYLLYCLSPSLDLVLYLSSVVTGDEGGRAKTIASVVVCVGRVSCALTSAAVSWNWQLPSKATTTTNSPADVASVLQLLSLPKFWGIRLPKASPLLLFQISLSCIPRQLEGLEAFNPAIAKSCHPLTEKKNNN